MLRIYCFKKKKTMKKAYIFHGHQKVSFEIPSRWRILTTAQFDEYSSKKDVKELTKNALKNPVHAKTLKHALSPSDKVAIIVEDPTRASPKRLILETLREKLYVVPIPRPSISVIMALGTHRDLTAEELESTFCINSRSSWYQRAFREKPVKNGLFICR